MSVWILMDPYGPVWVRMVPEDSLGASWGLLGPWGAQKGGFRVFGGGGEGGTPLPWALPMPYVGSSLIWPYGLPMVLYFLNEGPICK